MEENRTIHDLIHRRSIRKYQSLPLRQEDLDQILKAGSFAPSAQGKQPTVMVVLQRPEEIAELERLNCEYTTQEHPFYGAPCVVVVLADSQRPTCVEDGSLVMGNLMNAAAAIGVGSCWIHRARQEFDSPEGKALLKRWGLSDSMIGIGHCILGYPAEKPEAKPRKEGLIVKI